MHPHLQETGRKPMKYLWALVVGMVLFFAMGMAVIAYWISPGNLVGMLNSEKPAQKRWAADMLINKGVGRAGTTVLGAAVDPARDPEIRRMAIFILGEIHSVDAEPQLIALMKGNDPILSEQAAFALGRLGDDAVLNELLATYESAPKGLKLRILAGLGELGNTAAATLLQKEAARSDDDLMQATARQALSKLREKHPDCCR